MPHRRVSRQHRTMPCNAALCLGEAAFLVFSPAPAWAGIVPPDVTERVHRRGVEEPVVESEVVGIAVEIFIRLFGAGMAEPQQLLEGVLAIDEVPSGKSSPVPRFRLRRPS